MILFHLLVISILISGLDGASSSKDPPKCVFFQKLNDQDIPQNCHLSYFNDDQNVLFLFGNDVIRIAPSYSKPKRRPYISINKSGVHGLLFSRGKFASRGGLISRQAFIDGKDRVVIVLYNSGAVQGDESWFGDRLFDIINRSGVHTAKDPDYAQLSRDIAAVCQMTEGFPFAALLVYVRPGSTETPYVDPPVIVPPPKELYRTCRFYKDNRQKCSITAQYKSNSFAFNSSVIRLFPLSVDGQALVRVLNKSNRGLLLHTASDENFTNPDGNTIFINEGRAVAFFFNPDVVGAADEVTLKTNFSNLVKEHEILDETTNSFAEFQAAVNKLLERSPGSPKGGVIVYQSAVSKTNDIAGNPRPEAINPSKPKITLAPPKLVYSALLNDDKSCLFMDRNARLPGHCTFRSPETGIAVIRATVSGRHSAVTVGRTPNRNLLLASWSTIEYGRFAAKRSIAVDNGRGAAVFYNGDKLTDEEIKELQEKLLTALRYSNISLSTSPDYQNMHNLLSKTLQDFKESPMGAVAVYEPSLFGADPLENLSPSESPKLDSLSQLDNLQPEVEDESSRYIVESEDQEAGEETAPFWYESEAILEQLQASLDSQ